jgi:hypothetical protein
MDLASLERAPGDEICLSDGPLPDERGRDTVRQATLHVILEKDGEALAVLPVTVARDGYLVQRPGFEAPDTWDECWLTDGRVRVRARTPGPAGYVNGLVWK